MEFEEQSASGQATTEQAAKERTAFQEAAALKQWIDRDKPHGSTTPSFPSIRSALGRSIRTKARAILREANTTMVIVAPRPEELRVGTAKAVPG